MDETIIMPRYYVYQLVDPKDNSVFYIGKGVGERAFQHFHEAENDTIENEKINRIRKIKSEDNEPKIVVIGRYETEAEAFAVEATLIKWVHGKSSLTNIVHGHRHLNIREKGCLEEVPGIDIERKPKFVFDGSYSKNLRSQILVNQVFEKLEWAKSELEHLINNDGLQITVSDVDLSNPQDPAIFVTGFSEYAQIMIKIPPASGKNFVLNLMPSDKDKSVQFINNKDKYTNDLRKGGKFGTYAPVYFQKVPPRGKREVSIDKIDKVFLLIVNEINKIKNN